MGGYDLTVSRLNESSNLPASSNTMLPHRHEGRPAELEKWVSHFYSAISLPVYDFMRRNGKGSMQGGRSVCWFANDACLHSAVTAEWAQGSAMVLGEGFSVILSGQWELLAFSCVGFFVDANGQKLIEEELGNDKWYRVRIQPRDGPFQEIATRICIRRAAS